MHKRAIIIFGRPGAGKGFVSKKVLKHLLGFNYIGSGDTFRVIAARAQDGDPQAKYIYECMTNKKGSTRVDDTLTMDYVRRQIPETGECVFDTARSGKQVEIFCNMVKEFGYDTVIGLHLDASRVKCVQRLGGRPAKGEEVREDDQDPEVINRRQDEFEEYAPETLDALRQYTTYVHIDANFGEAAVAGLTIVQLEAVRPADGYVEHVSTLGSKLRIASPAQVSMCV